MKVSLSFLMILGIGAFAGSMYLMAVTGKPLLAVLPPFGILFLFITAQNPRFGYYTLIVLIPLSAWQGLMEQYKFLTISKLVGAWLVLVSLIWILFHPYLLKRLRSAIWFPLGILFIVSVISTAFSQHPLLGITFLRRLAVAYVFIALTMLYIRRSELFTTLPLLLMVSIGFAAMTATFGKLFNLPSVMIAVEAENITARAVGATSNPNFFAAMIIISLPLIAHYFFIKQDWKWRIPFGLLFLNNCYAVFISYSRSQFLVLIILMGIIGVEYFKKFRFKYIGFFLALVIVVSGVLAYKLPQTTIWKRMTTLSQPAGDRSLQRRASYYIVAFNSLKHNLFLGAGPGNYTTLYQNTIFSMAFGDENDGFARSAHNTYLELFTETGIFGLSCFLWLLGICLKEYYHASRLHDRTNKLNGQLIRSLGYSMISFIMSMFFFSNLQHKYLWMFAGLATVAGQILPEDTEHQDQNVQLNT